jgi:undecaprenyl phosphate N,N'-diacetylbacillosamine 1-phosphate transferase
MQTQVRANTSQVKTSRGGLYRRFFKRPMDFVLSLLALVVLSPVLLVVAVLVRLNLGSPVIFKQKRPGLNEKIFTMYKFRTMTDERDENGELLPDSVRLTKFGRWLRSTSLDELPELLNIL